MKTRWLLERISSSNERAAAATGPFPFPGEREAARECVRARARSNVPRAARLYLLSLSVNATAPPLTVSRSLAPPLTQARTHARTSPSGDDEFPRKKCCCRCRRLQSGIPAAVLGRWPKKRPPGSQIGISFSFSLSPPSCLGVFDRASCCRLHLAAAAAAREAFRAEARGGVHACVRA